MSKKQKGNRELRKPKAASSESKKQKKDLRNHDGAVGKLFES